LRTRSISSRGKRSCLSCNIPRSLVGSLEVRALLDVLAGRELPAQLAALDGYDAAPCGRDPGGMILTA